MDLVFVATNIDEQISQSEISVGPNPAAGYLMIKNVTNSKLFFVLHDVAGRKVAEWKLTDEANYIDIHLLTGGLYIYSVIYQDGIINTGKVIINR